MTLKSLIGDDIRIIERSTDVLLNTCEDIDLAVNTARILQLTGRWQYDRIM